MVYVNLPFTYARANPRVFETLAEHGLGAEFYAGAREMDLEPRGFFLEMAARARDLGIPIAAHLPFFELAPGSPDRLVLRAARERLAKTMELMRELEPAHMVGHADYRFVIHQEFFDEWLEASIETWQGLAKTWPDHAPLYLENTFEPDPEPLVKLLDALAAGDTNVGICFDVGHWHSFAKGGQKQDLDRWLDGLGPYIRHLHLHDNDGSEDQHYGLGQGAIPWAEFFQGLKSRSITPTATLEPHTPEGLGQSLSFFQAYPEFVAGLKLIRSE